MPSPQPPPAAATLRLDRFRPEIHRVETANYDQHNRGVLDNLSQMLKQSTFLTIKYGLIDAELDLDRMSGMEPDWDSYGAEPPSPGAIQSSREILNELAGALILPSAIVPSSEGGVSIYFMSGDRTAYIETDNDGSLALVMYDQQGNTEVLEFGRDIPRAEVGTQILAYLG
jgi:hypothetical protein